MCGIVGYISNNDKLYPEAKDHFMRYALALDTLRGEDSTGLITLSKRFTVKTLKTTMAGDRFVHSPEYRKKFKPGWAQTGHNRAATRGGVNIENAHPFIFGDVALVHNGTLWGGGDSLSTYDKKIGKVDSMQIAYALSKYPPEKAAEVLGQIDGSFALVWTDRRDESVNMARNEERPLHFTFNNSKSILWYMSDGHHLHSINKSFGNHECKGLNVFSMDKHKILKFTKGCTAPEVIKFNPFVRPLVTHAKWKNGRQVDTKSGGQTNSSGAALKTATDKWKRALESNSTQNSTTGSASTIKVALQGRRRKVPDYMQSALAKELYLTPDDLLQFQPDDAVEKPDGNYIVFGTMIHKEWNDTPWDMTIHNVSRLQYNAYREQDWLVRPIGLCPGHSYDRKSSAVLGHVVHCDWTGYQARFQAESTAESSDDDKEADTVSGTCYVEEDGAGKLLVPGPGGYMIQNYKLKKLLEAGCINCGGDLQNTPVQYLLEVNNGQDLMCGGCQREMYDSTAAPTIN
jgi:hypothetical protein